MGLLIDWNDPYVPVRTQIWAILTQSPVEWLEFIAYLWYKLRCEIQLGYMNSAKVQDWEWEQAALAWMEERDAASG